MLFIVLISLKNVLLADTNQQSDQINIHEYIGDPLFISLGSWCNVAINLKRNGMRKAAFPFDWIASVDCEKFLEIFTSDFKYFLDDNYLFIKDSHIFNNYYNLEFPHDQCLPQEMAELWATFKDKYMRRIDRFRELEHYKGKVYFIRSSFGYSNDPERHFKCAENISISDVYAWRLFHTLLDRFPQLDFTLIICDLVKEAKILSKNLIRLQDIPDLKAINDLFPDN